MSASVIYCKIPQGYFLVKEYFVCTPQQARHKKAQLKKTIRENEKILTRGGYVFIFKRKEK